MMVYFNIFLIYHVFSEMAEEIENLVTNGVRIQPPEKKPRTAPKKAEKVEVKPAKRREGDIDGIENAYGSNILFDDVYFSATMLQNRLAKTNLTPKSEIDGGHR